jgi:hypothetical protein
MKKQRTQSKLIASLTAIVLLLVALSATLTFAYFTAQSETTSDSLQFGTLTITQADIQLGSACGSCQALKTNLTPGCSVTLGGSATIASSIDYYVRANFQVNVTKENVNINAEPTDAIRTNGATTYQGIILEELFGAGAGTGIISDYFGDANWLAPTTADGYKYYLTKGLGSSQNDLNVFNFNTASNNTAPMTITFAADKYGNDWQGVNVAISLIFQAVQAEHLGITWVAADDLSEGKLTQSGVNKLAAANAWTSVATDGIYTA